MMVHSEAEDVLVWQKMHWTQLQDVRDWEHFDVAFIREFPAGRIINEVCFMYRLLNNLSLLAIGQSVGYETWPPIGWHKTFVIGWSKYMLGLPKSQWIAGSHIFKEQWHSPPTALTAGKLPAVRVVRGDCERVWLYVGLGELALMERKMWA